MLSHPSSAADHIAAEADVPLTSTHDGWGWLELFIVIQLLWGVLLFIPGAQSYRVFIRALPYVTSLGGLVWMLRGTSGERLPSSSRWLIAVFALLAANLLHGETHFRAGLAQLAFQIGIAAPMFWVTLMAPSETRVARLVSIIFVASLASAAIGVLQVYYPEQFLPPEFSTLARTLNPSFLGALSYIGPSGQLIVRPPGLTDLPGGAAVAGLATVLLGVAYATRDETSWPRRLLAASGALIGMTTLYLTQVRSLTVMAAIGVLIVAAIRLRQGRILQGGWIAIGGIALVAASFLWAAAIGGKAIEDRFSGLIETGLFTTFQENRGLFLDYTFRELLFDFPLGAGLGRWGMMQVYFTDPAMWRSPPIHVEIQITGWLLDGGVLMWLCYGGALVSAIKLAYTSAVGRAGGSLRHVSGVVLAFQLAVIGLCLTGPVFNTQLGVIFWTVTGALCGATRTEASSNSGQVHG